MPKVIQNVSSSIVVLSYPNHRFRVRLTPGRKSSIPDEVYDEMKYDSGALEMLANGAIKFVVNTEEEQEEIAGFTDVAGDRVIMTPEEVEKLLKEGTVAEFSEVIKNASQVTRETIANLAVKFSIADSVRTALIKKYCGVDVIQTLSLQQD